MIIIFFVVVEFIRIKNEIQKQRQSNIKRKINIYLFFFLGLYTFLPYLNELLKELTYYYCFSCKKIILNYF